MFRKSFQPHISERSGRFVAAVSVTALLAISACTKPQPGAEFNDPHEKQNRVVHAGNVAFDRVVFGGGNPDKKPYLPQPIAQGFTNFASNLSMPGAVVNSVLQGRPKPALKDTFRFVVNSTVGIAGLFDPATAMGVTAETTDFGETLHVWGAPEGAYLEVPVIGPTTERDLLGKVVDVALDPLNHVIKSPQSNYVAFGKIGSKVADRQRYSETIESILYGSADSYAQTRLLYLQNRRFKLGIEADVFDPYKDPYGQ